MLTQKTDGTDKAMTIPIDNIQLIDEKLHNAVLLREDTIDSKKHLIDELITELLDERLRLTKNV